jgi:DNA polymerase III alpha subunit (gram-positive type)
MNNAFKKLASEINYIPSNSFKDAEIISAKLLENDVFKINFLLKDFVEIKDLVTFFNALNNFKFKTKIDFEVINKVFSVEKIFNYFIFIGEKFLGFKNIHNNFLLENFKLNDNSLSISFLSNQLENDFNENKILFEKHLFAFGFKNILIESLASSLGADAIQEDRHKNNETSKRASKNIDNTKKVETKMLKNNRSYVKTTIKNSKESDLVFIEIQGKVYNLDYFQTKSGLFIISASITDYEDAIIVKIFARSELELNKYKNTFIVDS